MTANLDLPLPIQPKRQRKPPVVYDPTWQAIPKRKINEWCLEATGIDLLDSWLVDRKEFMQGLNISFTQRAFCSIAPILKQIRLTALLSALDMLLQNAVASVTALPKRSCIDMYMGLVRDVFEFDIVDHGKPLEDAMLCRIGSHARSGLLASAAYALRTSKATMVIEEKLSEADRPDVRGSTCITLRFDGRRETYVHSYRWEELKRQAGSSTWAQYLPPLI